MVVTQTMWEDDEYIDVAGVLRDAVRQGAETDNPEGSRYIVLSETLVNQLIRQLESGTSMAY